MSWRRSVHMLLKPQTRKTRQIAWGGLLTGLSLIFIAAAAAAPAGSLALFSLASLCVAIAVIRLGLRPACLVVVSCSLLALAWPGPLLSIPYTLLFGPYPILKALAENKWNNPLTVRLIKQAAATLMAAVAVVLITLAAGLDALLPDSLPYGLGDLPGFWMWTILVLLAELILFLYDYGLTLLITLYMRRLHRHL